MSVQNEKKSDIQSEILLKREGYKQELDRVLSVPQTVGLVLSDITPTASLFVIAAAVFPIAGTGTMFTFLIAGLVAICVAFSMAELGSSYPIAGGLYSIITRVLGRPLGFIAMTDYIMQAIFLPAAIALGIGSYMTMLIPGISGNIWATILMVAVTIVAVFSVRTNANITGIFLAIELVVLLIIIALGITHPHIGTSMIFKPSLFSDSSVSPVSFSVILGTIAIALFSFNGYDSAINFSEETNGSARNVGRSVMAGAILGVLFQFLAVLAMLIGIKDQSAFFTASLPVFSFLESYLGNTVSKILVIGVIFAVINGTLAIVLQFARIIYSTARDQSWPGPVSKAFSNIHPKFKTPWAAVLFVGLTGSVLTFFGSVISAITFTSVLIVILYALTAIAAIVNRIRKGSKGIPFKMWIWPIPPVIALVGAVFALSRQAPKDLFICAAIFAVGLIYYFAGARFKDGLWKKG